ncbi:MAG: Uma2 family endonuclease [Isosphaeraceae bacterium]
MATPSSYPTTKGTPPVEYPTGDGKPMAETPIHRDNMIAMLDVLRARYAADPMVYISGNMFLYYVPGKKRRHVSPDVFLVRDIPNKDRDAYFVWEEGKGPDVVFEYTSKSTRNEDLDDKYNLYQDVLKVSEYFLFDPKQEYLTPSLQGFRLRSGRYVPIEPVEGRLPSEVLGLHLEREGAFLRLHDPATGQKLLTSWESLSVTEAALRKAEAEKRQAEAEKRKAEQERLLMAKALSEAKAEQMAAQADRERIQRELEELRRKLKATD